MKEYVTPEVEYLEFVMETITDNNVSLGGTPGDGEVDPE